MSNVELHQRAHRAMSEEGADQAAAYFAPDIVYTDNARGLTMKGKEEATGWLTGWKSAFSDARITNATYLAADDWTISQFHGRGVNDGPLGDLPATGKQLDMPYCELLRWRDDKAVEGGIYYDTGTMMVQLGHMEPPPA
jgi:ketosteroid isomerase-like protein